MAAEDQERYKYFVTTTYAYYRKRDKHLGSLRRGQRVRITGVQGDYVAVVPVDEQGKRMGQPGWFPQRFVKAQPSETVGQPLTTKVIPQKPSEIIRGTAVGRIPGVPQLTDYMAAFGTGQPIQPRTPLGAAALGALRRVAPPLVPGEMQKLMQPVSTLLRPADIPSRLIGERIRRGREGIEGGARAAYGKVVQQTLVPEVYGETPTSFGEEVQRWIAPPGSKPGAWRQIGAGVAGLGAELAVDPLIWLWGVSYKAPITSRLLRRAVPGAIRGSVRGLSRSLAVRIERAVVKDFAAMEARTGRFAQRLHPEQIAEGFPEVIGPLEDTVVAAVRRVAPELGRSVAADIGGQFTYRIYVESQPALRWWGRRVGRRPPATLLQQTVGALRSDVKGAAAAAEIRKLRQGLPAPTQAGVAGTGRDAAEHLRQVEASLRKLAPKDTHGIADLLGYERAWLERGTRGAAGAFPSGAAGVPGTRGFAVREPPPTLRTAEELGVEPRARRLVAQFTERGRTLRRRVRAEQAVPERPGEVFDIMERPFRAQQRAAVEGQLGEARQTVATIGEQIAVLRTAAAAAEVAEAPAPAVAPAPVPAPEPEVARPAVEPEVEAGVDVEQLQADLAAIPGRTVEDRLADLRTQLGHAQRAQEYAEEWATEHPGEQPVGHTPQTAAEAVARLEARIAEVEAQAPAPEPVEDELAELRYELGHRQRHLRNAEEWAADNPVAAAVPGSRLDRAQGEVARVEAEIAELEAGVAGAPVPAAPATDALPAEQQAVLAVLSTDQQHIDAIAQAANLPRASTTAALMMLEVKGFALRLPGDCYTVKSVPAPAAAAAPAARPAAPEPAVAEPAEAPAAVTEAEAVRIRMREARTLRSTLREVATKLEERATAAFERGDNAAYQRYQAALVRVNEAAEMKQALARQREPDEIEDVIQGHLREAGMQHVDQIAVALAEKMGVRPEELTAQLGATLTQMSLRGDLQKSGSYYFVAGHEEPPPEPDPRVPAVRPQVSELGAQILATLEEQGGTTADELISRFGIQAMAELTMLTLAGQIVQDGLTYSVAPEAAEPVVQEPQGPEYPAELEDAIAAARRGLAQVRTWQATALDKLDVEAARQGASPAVVKAIHEQAEEALAPLQEPLREELERLRPLLEAADSGKVPERHRTLGDWEDVNAHRRRVIAEAAQVLDEPEPVLPAAPEYSVAGLREVATQIGQQVRAVAEAAKLAAPGRLAEIAAEVPLRMAQEEVAELEDRLDEIEREDALAPDMQRMQRAAEIASEEQRRGVLGPARRLWRAARAHPGWQVWPGSIRTEIYQARIKSLFAGVQYWQTRLSEDGTSILRGPRNVRFSQDERVAVGMVAAMEEHQLRQEMMEIPAGERIAYSESDKLQVLMCMMGHETPASPHLGAEGQVRVDSLPKRLKAAWTAKNQLLEWYRDIWEGNKDYEFRGMGIEEMAAENAERRGEPPPGRIPGYVHRPGQRPAASQYIQLEQEMIEEAARTVDYIVGPEAAQEIWPTFKAEIERPATYESGIIRLVAQVLRAREEGGQPLKTAVAQLMIDWDPGEGVHRYVQNVRRIMGTHAIYTFVEDTFVTEREMVEQVGQAEVDALKGEGWTPLTVMRRPVPGLEEYLLPPAVANVLEQRYILDKQVPYFLQMLVDGARKVLRPWQVANLVSIGFCVAQLFENVWNLGTATVEAVSTVAPWELPGEIRAHMRDFKEAAAVAGRVAAHGVLEEVEHVPPGDMAQWLKVKSAQIEEAVADYIFPNMPEEKVTEYLREIRDTGLLSEGYGVAARRELEEPTRAVGRALGRPRTEVGAAIELAVSSVFNIDNVHRLLIYLTAREAGESVGAARQRVRDLTVEYGWTGREPFDDLLRAVSWYYLYTRQRAQQFTQLAIRYPGLAATIEEAYRKRKRLVGWRGPWAHVVNAKPGWMDAGWVPLHAQHLLLRGIELPKGVFRETDGMYFVYGRFRFPGIEEPSNILQWAAQPLERVIPPIRWVLEQRQPKDKWQYMRGGLPLVGRLRGLGRKVPLRAPGVYNYINNPLAKPPTWATLKAVAEAGQTPDMAKAPARLHRGGKYAGKLTKAGVEYEMAKMRMYCDLAHNSRKYGISLYAVSVEDLINNMTTKELTLAIPQADDKARAYRHGARKRKLTLKARLEKELEQRRAGQGPRTAGERLGGFIPGLAQPVEQLFTPRPREPVTP